MPANWREQSLLDAIAAYASRFGRRDVNLVEALDTRKSQPQIAMEHARQPWKAPDTHRPSAVLSHLRSMGYRGDADTLEGDVRSLERQGLLVRTGSRSWAVAEES